MKNKQILLFGALSALTLSASLFSGCLKTKDVSKILPLNDSAIITSVYPATAKAGDILTIYGSNLLKDTLSEKVTVNNKDARIILFTNDSLKAVLQTGTGSGAVVITVGNKSYPGPIIHYNYKITVTTITGTGEVGHADGDSLNATFNCPEGIVADLNGDLYVADCYNRLIRKISAGTNTVTSIQLPNSIGSNTFYNPYNITLDTKTHNLYVTDFNTHVLKIGAAENMEVIYTDAMATAGIALGDDGYIYMANNSTGTITKMDTSGGNRSIFAQNLVTPRSIVFDKNNIMYVAAFNGALNAAVINKISSTGIVSIANKDKDFQGWEIAVDSSGNFYEADHFANVIKMIDKHGVVTVIAGNGVAADIDGIGTSASINSPQGIAIDAAGNLYVTTFNYQDNTGNKVRKITFD